MEVPLKNGKPLDAQAISYINDLMNSEKTLGHTVEALVKNGYDYNESVEKTTEIYMNAIEAQKEKEKSNAPLELGLGILILVIGIAVTAGSSGGVIAYGAIIVGAIKIISGLANLAK